MKIYHVMCCWMGVLTHVQNFDSVQVFGQLSTLIAYISRMDKR